MRNSPKNNTLTPRIRGVRVGQGVSRFPKIGHNRGLGSISIDLASRNAEKHLAAMHSSGVHLKSTIEPKNSRLD